MFAYPRRVPPVDVRNLDDPADHAAVAELLGSIWHDDGTVPIEPHLFTAVAHGGGYVAGAYDAVGTLVGASLGLLARTDREWVLHSHVTGVRRGLEHRGIGAQVKRHQRVWARTRDLAAVTWTFDPLVRRNAWFNLAKLGAAIVGYRRNFYGTTIDDLNAGDETDRVLVRWDVAVDAANTTRSGVVVVDTAGVYTRRPVDANVVNIATPLDVVGLRTVDPAGALAWRHATRDAFEDAFATGFVVRGIDGDGTYTLERP